MKIKGLEITRTHWGFLLAVVAVAGVVISGVFAPKGTSALAPAGFTETLIASGLTPPSAMKIAPDGRVFVLEQNGRVRVVKNDVLLSTPFTTFTVDNVGERGLSGIAFDPDFATNGYIYFYYTATTPTTHNRLVRVTANGDVMAPGSEVVLMDFPTLTAEIHNGGALNFGSDGKLYISLGENGTGSNAQSLNTVLGKILRVNKDGSIPTDNPFYGSTTGMNRAIWALGLRNPFTFDFQPGTGRMYINDVGAATWEEINEGAPGANFGWPTTEGPTTNPSFRSPVYAYGHGNGGASTGCAVVGGAFYNPATTQFPASYVGKYFFADLCSGWIRVLDPATRTASSFITSVSVPVDLEVGANGTLYYITRHAYSSGRIYKVTYSTGSGSTAPSIISQPTSQSIAVGATATFSVTVSGTGPFSYQWRKNGTPISGATNASYTTPVAVADDSGSQYTVTVTNTTGSITSSAAVLTVTSNRPPVATINTPTSGALYSAGTNISFSGSATDPDQGNLSASALSWTVLFHHNDVGGEHTHPVIGPITNTASGSFNAPTIGETSANVWYRIYLTATDAQGSTHTVTRDVNPRTAQITLNTVPAGLQINLDGQPQTTPITISSVAGTLRNLEVLSPQNHNGSSYQFSSWSDGLGRAHDISSPTANTTYTATFTAIPVVDTPPVVTASTASASITLGSSVVLSASATDDRGVAGVRFYTNGVARGNEDTTSPYQTTWTPTAAGTYTVNAVARDTIGQRATSTNAVSVTVTSVPTASCGNGIIEGTEQCDDVNLNSQTCISRGYVSGTLSCSATCTFNTTQCVASTTTGNITTLTLVSRLEGISTVASRSHTIIIQNAATNAFLGVYTQQSNAQGIVTLSGLSLPTNVQYNLHVSVPYSLRRIMRNVTISSAPITLPLLPAGNLNNDTAINSLDWDIMRANWGGNNLTADINRDGIVNSVDFSYLNKNWMQVRE
jgi:cysteine-rich repeat protein